MFAEDRFLLNTVAFQYMCLFCELTTCLLTVIQVACLIEVARKTVFLLYLALKIKKEKKKKKPLESFIYPASF